MNKLRSSFLLLAAALVAVAAGTRAEAGMSALPSPQPQTVLSVQGNCSAIGAQVAAQYGGRVGRASLQNRGGQQVCVIVVIVDGKNGERGRREEVVVPAN